jgi:hypothetical protein
MRDDVEKRFTEPSGRYYGHAKYPRTCKKLNKSDQEGEPIESLKNAHILAGQHDGSGPNGEDHVFLRRLLRGNVGRLWNDVYSEICSHAEQRTFVGTRLREAVERLVELNCTIEGEEVIGENGFPILHRRTSRLYVHPLKKTLEYVSRPRRKRKEEERNPVRELNGKLYHRHLGLWYEVEMKLIRKKPNQWGGFSYSGYGIVDAFSTVACLTHVDRCTQDWCKKLQDEYGLSPEGDYWYAVSKRSAGKKEIEKLKKKYDLG